jgi:DNA-directed RNA polymerase subunit RPC12/RpoP
MSNRGQIYEVKCPTCGAPLPKTGERIVCDYCGSVLERPRPAVQEEPKAPERQQPSVVVIQTEYSSSRRSRPHRAGFSCVSFLLLFILVAGAVLALVWYQTGNLLAQFSLSSLAQLPAKIANTVSIISLDTTNGRWQAVGPTPDYDLIPLAVVDNLLIVRATRSRGTPRSELWGLDLVSGEQRWQYVLQAQRWFKEAGSEPAWDWRLTPHGLVVLQLFSDPDQLVVEKLESQTGVSSGQNTIPLEDNFLTGIAWNDAAAWLAIRKIYALDLATSSLSYTWP